MTEIRIVFLVTPSERLRGLQFLPAIAPDAIYVFPGTYYGGSFHSRNVVEPFDIAFLSRELIVLKIERMIPPHSLAVAPVGSSMAVEAKAGKLLEWGFRVGQPAFNVE